MPGGRVCAVDPEEPVALLLPLIAVLPLVVLPVLPEVLDLSRT
ncbi:MAG TPA: hypothetical protein VJR70_03425 [Stellaceae bacterium]|nr:hypothetical protein [Stellaceae bacterium]